VCTNVSVIHNYAERPGKQFNVFPPLYFNRRQKILNSATIPQILSDLNFYKNIIFATAISNTAT
jgi:hypothetical protein